MTTSSESLQSDDQDFARRERLSGGPSDGVEVVTLSYAGTTVRVCPTRGLGVLDVTVGETAIKWDSPVQGPVHPALVNLHARNQLGWLDGFTELVARCGLVYVGPPGADDAAGPIDGDITLHGRVANLPAYDVVIDRDADGVFVRGTVDDSVLFGAQLRMTSEVRVDNDGRVAITDAIHNFGPNPSEYQILYHINVGSPILRGGTTIRIENADEICPRDPRAAEGIDSWATCLPPTPGYAEQAYFVKPAGSSARASLVNEDGTAFHVDFVADELPCLTLWKCTHPEEAGYVVGLEPGTSYPNHKSYEREHGRVPKLAPGETVTKSLVLSYEESYKPTESEASPQIHLEPTAPMAVPVSP